MARITEAERIARGISTDPSYDPDVRATRAAEQKKRKERLAGNPGARDRAEAKREAERRGAPDGWRFDGVNFTRRVRHRLLTVPNISYVQRWEDGGGMNRKFFDPQPRDDTETLFKEDV